MGKRHCWKCQTRHGKPTGQKCQRIRHVVPEDTDLARKQDGQPFRAAAEGGDKSEMPPVLPDNLPISDEDIQKPADVEKRLDSMESLLYKLTENIWPQRDAGHGSRRKHRSPSYSSVDTFRERHRSSRRRSSKDSPSRYRYNADNYFRDEETQANTFEAIMVATFRTITEMYEDGEDINGILSHGQYMAEKAAASVNIPDAFTGYDRFVRQVASRKGPQAFATISELECSRYFNLENYREVRAFRARNKAQGNQKSKSSTCRHYNGENGCFARSCQYVHRCSVCDLVGHPAKECKSGKKERPQK